MYERFLSEIISYFEDQKKSLLDKKAELVLLSRECDSSISKLKKSVEDPFSVFDPRYSGTSQELLSDFESKKNTISSSLMQTEASLSQFDNFLSCLYEADKRDESFELLVSSAKEKELVAISLQEEDRKRISRDLHDTSLQNLTYLSHKLELAGMFIDQDSERAKLELCIIRKDLKKVSEDIRNTIHNIRPMSFDDIGFKDSILHMLNSLNSKAIYLDIDIDDVSRDNVILINLYRILQEAMGNCMKYSNASKISISIKERENKLYIHFKDNGVGFSIEDVKLSQDCHYGIHFMEERVLLIGGSFHIESSIDNGTIIEIVV